MYKFYSYLVATIIASVFFAIELPIRLASLIVLMLFFVISSLFAPIVAKKIDITEWYEWTFYFEKSIFVKVRNAYLKAFGY